MNVLDRTIYNQIKSALTQYPILAVTGPRQSGKTTLLKTMFKDYRYLNLENPDTREFAIKDPKGFLAQYNDKVIFDEVQYIPSLFSYLQALVDENQVMGQFILSGSQNFNLMQNITQSLAGRVALFKLFPFDLQEMKASNWLHSDLTQVITHGFYPALFERNIDPDRYYANYIETYVKRDVSQLVNIQDQRTFSNFLKILATRAGQLTNFNDLAKDVGVSHTTIRNWISILETSYIVFMVQPYFKNYGKRMIKSPKLYFHDVGLLCHLLSIRKGNLDPTHPLWGSIFENFIVSELNKQNAHQGLLRDYYFWRDSKGHEVDLLHQTTSELTTYEIKASSTIQSRMFEGLDYFKSITDDVIAQQILIYGGKEAQNRTDYSILNWEGIN